MASISAWTWGSGGGTSFGGGGAFAWGGGGGGFLPWGGGGGFLPWGGGGFLAAAPGGGIGGFFAPAGGFFAAPGGGRGGGGFSPFGGGMGAFFVGGTGFLGGGGGLGGRGLAFLDAASAPGDGGASLAAVSSFWPSPASPDHQLDQDPAAAWAHSSATSRRRSMVRRVRYQTRAAISVAKRCSLAALRLAAPSYRSIFGQKSELAVCKTLAQQSSSFAIALAAAVQRLGPSDRRTALPDAIAAHQAHSEG